MSTPSRHSRLEVKHVGKVTVVRFPLSRILGEGPCEATGKQLQSLVGDARQRHVVLNFAGVERLDSAMLAKLITLHKKIEAGGGRLAICHLGPALSETFQTLQLHRLLNIYGEEPEALQAFA